MWSVSIYAPGLGQCIIVVDPSPEKLGTVIPRFNAKSNDLHSLGI